MRAEEIKGLMEAYSQVHGTAEVLNEEVEQIEEQEGGISNTPYQSRFARPRNANTVRRNSATGEVVVKPKISSLPTDLKRTELSATAAGQRVAGRVGGGNAGASVQPPAKPVTRSATSPAPKPAATATSKPTTPAAPAKPAGSAMDQWAKANPKLAAAKAERDRTRGTSATTNPLMKDMKSSMPAPKSPAPSTAKTGFDLAKKGVNLAAGVDIFDLVKGHLLDEGYADTEEGAMVIMVNMSEEWRKSILESHGVELDESASSRREGESESEFIMRRRTEYMRPRRGPEHETERTSYSPKRARAGEDIGKPGKMFGKIAKEAGERYGSKERGEKVAGAVLAKLRKEDLESWVDELIAEGYDLSEYTWEEVAEIYAQELELSEAQRARENPEDHDKEEKRKYEPVRGERTPMPPRGDKRREDFEKWYAKQMGR